MPVDISAIKKGSLQRSASSPNLSQVAQLMVQLQLNAGPDSVDKTLEETAEVLSQLTRKSSYRVALMGTSGAVSTIAGLLNSSPAVARHAAAALQNLALEPENCSNIVASGCLKPLMQLLQAPDDNDALLAAAAGALSNLAYEAEHCNKIASAPGCVKRLVQLLSHSSCVVREGAASVLGKLAFEPELCEPIAGKAGALSLLSLLLAADSVVVDY